MSLNDVRDVYLGVVLFLAPYLSSVASQLQSDMYHGVGGSLEIMLHSGCKATNQSVTHSAESFDKHILS